MRKGTLEPEHQYLMRRLAEEEAAAERSVNARARQSHLEMARRYREACEKPEIPPGAGRPSLRSGAPISDLPPAGPGRPSLRSGAPISNLPPAGPKLERVKGIEPSS